MITRYFLVPTILGIAGLLFAPDAAFAQKGGGGRGGGGGGGGGRGFSGAGRGGSISPARAGGPSISSARAGGPSISSARAGGTNIARAGNVNHAGNMNHNGIHYHNGNYYRHGYNYGAFYPGFWLGIGGYLWDGGYGPRVAYYTDAGQQPLPDSYAQDPPRNAQVLVLLPDPNAKVWFDGAPTTSTGTERLYHTPDLSPGASNTYRMRAAWTANGKEVIQEREATVAPGRGTVVDFSRPATEAIMPPAIK